MEIKTKNIIVYAAAAVGLYFIYTKFIKKATPATSATPNAAPKSQAVQKPSYPANLKEGDYIKVGDYAEVYLLKDGKKLPITYDWMMRYASDKWDSIITIQPVDGIDIPTGDVLSV
jgi:hypothetical protein